MKRERSALTDYDVDEWVAISIGNVKQIRDYT